MTKQRRNGRISSVCPGTRPVVRSDLSDARHSALREFPPQTAARRGSLALEAWAPRFASDLHGHAASLGRGLLCAAFSR